MEGRLEYYFFSDGDAHMAVAIERVRLIPISGDHSTLHKQYPLKVNV